MKRVCHRSSRSSTAASVATHAAAAAAVSVFTAIRCSQGRIQEIYVHGVFFPSRRSAPSNGWVVRGSAVSSPGGTARDPAANAFRYIFGVFGDQRTRLLNKNLNIKANVFSKFQETIFKTCFRGCFNTESKPIAAALSFGLPSTLYNPRTSWNTAFDSNILLSDKVTNRTA